MFNTENLQVEYINNILEGLGIEEKEVEKRIGEAGEYLDYEIDKHLVGLIPKEMEDRTRVMLNTTKDMIDNWKKQSSMNNEDWELVISMYKAIQAIIYFSNCTSHQKKEPILYDVIELKKKFENIVTSLENLEMRLKE